MTVDSLRNVYLIGHAIVTYEVIKINTILIMLASEDLNWHELQCSIQIKSKWQYIMGKIVSRKMFNKQRYTLFIKMLFIHITVV